MTERLYEQNAYCRSFEATVAAVEKENGRYIVTLDKSAFFPEGGGQPGDRGTIGGCAVSDTQMNAGGEILHYMKKEPDFAAGEKVSCALDWTLRFARMQAHTGEHIVSGLAHRLTGAENVGFHMDGTLMTVDFDLPLSKETLDEIERQANERVYENAAVRAFFPSPAEAENLVYRSKLEFVERLRLVEIEGVDLCACCAPHVKRTGEIGLIKILTAVSHRGGVRITLLCGRSAYEDYAVKYKNTLYCADLLKEKHNELPRALDALLEKEGALRLKLAAASKKYTDQVISSAPRCAGHGAVFVEEATNEELCRIAEACKTRCGGISACFGGDDCKGYCFAMSLPDEKYLPFTKTILEALRGRGGGKGCFLQGKCAAGRAEIEAFFAGFAML